MPATISCPFCHNPMTVSHESIGFVVSCPFCRQPLTVPNLHSPMYQPVLAQNEDDQIRVAPSRRKRDRKPKSSKTWLIATVLVFCFAAVGVVLGLKTNWFGTNTAQEQLPDRLDHVVGLNRTSALCQQVDFWLAKKIDISIVEPLADESARHAQADKDAEAKMKKRWGDKLKLLPDLDNERAKKFKVLCDATTKIVESRLKACHAIMLAEFELTQAKLYAENPVTLSEFKSFDLSTVEGMRKAEEQKILLPAKDKLAVAERDAKVAKLYADAVPRIMRKWVTKCREECQTEIAKLEEEFRK